ncbi:MULTISPECIES: tetratricopeptide repeat protein [Streptacidiphilus]|uniref:Tetratricopeptide repeat protein n=1 Tax=Streptacidiphilus cavernicola TaxID=3342716 RepID=A0ABV6USZ3_9ACTN|nr:tetratricopeptide repeat protein [Streptacidiphilus jeojiense]
MLPARAGHFQDRDALGALEEAVVGGGTAVVCQVLAGMGGVGKTQLAAHYARHTWQQGGVDLLVWVTASTRPAVVDAYAHAGADLLGIDLADPEQAARAFLAWLEPKPGQQPRWLIVLDDLADPADLRGLWPPAHPHGSTLVTTRRRDSSLGTHGTLVPVGLFTEAEATAYLATALASIHRQEPADALADLARDLGYLPLALSQAAAYLTDTALDVTTYRALLANRTRQLSDLLPEPGTLPDDQATTVAAAWTLSVERADQLRPYGLARPMLQLAAMLDPNGIPHTVLTSPPALAHLANHRTATEGDGSIFRKATAEEAAGALRALHRLHLIDHTPTTPHHAVRVHQLIQRATRDPLTLERYDHCARSAADALNAAWPAIESDTALAQALRANTQILTRHAGRALHQPDTHPVLHRTGRSLGEAGQATAARHYFQLLTETSNHHLGADHRDTLSARHDLAYWRGETGDVTGAATAFTDLLEDRLRVLGADHRDTLATRHHLAHWRGETGDAAGAATAFTDLLEDMLRVLGADHRDTLAARHDLARWRGEAGDVTGAATAFTDLLEDMLRVLGADHRDTLTTRHHLAHWRGETGDAAGAATATADLLEDMLRVLGADHPDTLATRHTLAHWRGQAGDAAGAATAFTDLLEDQLRVLGADHPHTLVARGNQAYWRGQAGDAAGAAAATAELLEDMLTVLGADHPETLANRRNLVRWRRASREVNF